MTGGMAALLVGVAPGDVAAADGWRHAEYVLEINGSGIDWVVEIPRALPHHVGLGQVRLVKDRGYREAYCDARGAGYMLPDEVQEGIVGGKGDWRDDTGQEVPDTTLRAPVVRYNPTMSRSAVPENAFVRRNGRPGVRPPIGRDGPVTPVPTAGSSPVRWESECAPSGLAGSGTGRDLNQLGVHVAGGLATASMDKATGRYRGTARGWATDVRTIAATVGSVTSQLQVNARPGAEPTIGYRISINDVQGLGSKHRLDSRDVELVGVDVPALDLVDHFNEQVRANATALSALGPLGLALLAPKVERIEDRYAIAAPVVVANLGLAAREGTVGQNQAVLLGATRFQGFYAAAGIRPSAPA
ncbi:MAG: hypothetical protein ACT4QG_13240 [Sporichthyaceae bacterium]